MAGTEGTNFPHDLNPSTQSSPALHHPDSDSEVKVLVPDSFADSSSLPLSESQFTDSITVTSTQSSVELIDDTEQFDDSEHDTSLPLADHSIPDNHNPNFVQETSDSSVTWRHSTLLDDTDDTDSQAKLISTNTDGQESDVSHTNVKSSSAVTENEPHPSGNDEVDSVSNET